MSDRKHLLALAWSCPRYSRLSSDSLHSLVACSCLCRIEVWWVLPSSILCDHRCPCLTHVVAGMLMRLNICNFSHYWKTQSYSKLPDLLTHTCFLAPLLQYSSSFRFRSCFLDVSIRTELYSGAYTLTVTSSSIIRLKIQSTSRKSCLVLEF